MKRICIIKIQKANEIFETGFAVGFESFIRLFVLENSNYLTKGRIKMEKQTIQKLGLLCASVALCSAVSLWNGNDEADRLVLKAVEQPAAAEVRQPVQVTVCVSGAVVNPGVYQVEKGSRAQQVIELAGGVTEEADMDRVNLAQLCRDGGHIKVSRLSQARLKKRMPGAKNEEKRETDAQKNTDVNRQRDLETITVHLNSATETELEQLPGVGKATARQIVMFRSKSSFQKLEDIMQVPGIGPAKFEKMRPYLVL
ncbi:MAG: helix-hairpin-helix domain-containing protein [Acidaminococcaceae bacterium]|nr:helix-hairpin-helix domain-containing protein [Acidaminococcaceae bacterium]